MAFADEYHIAYTIKSDRQSTLQKSAPLKMMIDSLSLSNNITKPSTTRIKTLMSDPETVEKCCEKYESNDVAFISPEHNTTDALTQL